MSEHGGPEQPDALFPNETEAKLNEISRGSGAAADARVAEAAAQPDMTLTLEEAGKEYEASDNNPHGQTEAQIRLREADQDQAA
jgi:hypothetical protein